MSPDDAATLTIGAHLNGKITIFRGSPSDGLMLRRRSFQLSREVQHEQRQGEMGADHIVDWACVIAKITHQVLYADAA